MAKQKVKKYRSTAAVLLTITLIAVLVLAGCVLFIYLAGIRYIRVRSTEGEVKFFGRVDDAGDPISGTIVYDNGIRAKVDLEKSEIVYSNGDRYEGPLSELRRSGEGHLWCANGDEYTVHDDRAVLEFFAQNAGNDDFVEKAFGNADFWGEDLSAYKDFSDTVRYWCERIREDVKSALCEVLK